MPQMANITVKDTNGTTDVVFTALSPAGADGSPAVWREEDPNRLPGDRPRLEISSKWNEKKDARKVSIFLNYPVMQATPVAGIFQRTGNVQFREGYALTPMNASDAVSTRAATLYGNLMTSALIKSVFTTGYAPN